MIAHTYLVLVQKFEVSYAENPSYLTCVPGYMAKAHLYQWSLLEFILIRRASQAILSESFKRLIMPERKMRDGKDFERSWLCPWQRSY